MIEIEEITRQLEQIASDENFEYLAERLSESWIMSGVGAEAVEPIVKFMEAHPEIDFGAPGALVHMIERPFGAESTERDSYEDVVLASIKRKPTMHTAWLLYRIINATSSSTKRDSFIQAFSDALGKQTLDEPTREQIMRFLEYQAARKQ